MCDKWARSDSLNNNFEAHHLARLGKTRQSCFYMKYISVYSKEAVVFRDDLETTTDRRVWAKLSGAFVLTCLMEQRGGVIG